MGATLIPVIFGIDETNVNVLGRMSCYPLYLTIGNIPKKIRRTYSQHAYVLVGYLPSLNATGMEGSKAAFTEARRMLYHECMRMVIRDLDDATQRYTMTFYRSSCLNLYPDYLIYVLPYPTTGDASGSAQTDRLVTAIRLLQHSKWTTQNPRC